RYSPPFSLTGRRRVAAPLRGYAVKQDAIASDRSRRRVPSHAAPRGYGNPRTLAAVAASCQRHPGAAAWPLIHQTRVVLLANIQRAPVAGWDDSATPAPQQGWDRHTLYPYPHQ